MRSHLVHGVLESDLSNALPLVVKEGAEETHSAAKACYLVVFFQGLAR